MEWNTEKISQSWFQPLYDVTWVGQEGVACEGQERDVM